MTTELFSSSFILEGAQAGSSWTTILKKRENYRKALDGYHAEKIARYNARDVRRLLVDPGIVRNRLKVTATIQNAKALLAAKGNDLRRLSYVHTTGSVVLRNNIPLPLDLKAPFNIPIGLNPERIIAG